MENNGRFKKGERVSPNTEFKKGEHWRPPAPFREQEYLLCEYVEKQKSMGDIAAVYGVSEQAIRFWLVKHKIPRRNISEARKIKHWGNSGEDNPMFGKRGEQSSNWKGGHTPERASCYSSPEWTTAVKAVWRRDRGVCQRCNKVYQRGAVIHIHHLVSFSVAASRCDPTNLIFLCYECHKWVHSLKNIDQEYIRKED